MFFSKRKRKNDDPQSFRLWPMVLVVILVIAAFFAGTQVSSHSSNDEQVVWPTQDLILTATSMVREATAQAAGITEGVKSGLDPIELTATRIIEQATAFAQGTPQPGFEINKP